MKIKVYHYRVPQTRVTFMNMKKGPPPSPETLISGKDGSVKWLVSPKGGVTKAIIVDDEDHVLAEGIARCSMADNFCRKIGRAKAIGRAIQKLGEIEREEITKANPALRF